MVPISQTKIGFLKDSVFILISWMLGSRTLLQLRGGNFRHWLNSTSGIMQAYVSFILKRAQGVIVLGEKLRSLFANHFPNERIFVVPNGADFPVNPGVKKISGRVRLLYLANLQASKGIEDVMEAAVRIREQSGIAGYELHVVGDWFSDGIKENILELVQRNDLPVIFHGIATGAEKWSFFREADIFIFPPREPEGHPWVIIEAMAAVLPIISTDQGAITESVIDGLNGFIVDTQSPAQIAAKILLLIQNEELRLKMGRESRRLYEENFTEGKMVERLSHAFNAVLSDRCAG
ncbi:MAG: glycosyltransferase family 4 protein [Nitrospirae bacterium]|nr:glycosyltransferase family 4 protein [Nitrospirota bacterium]